LLEQLTPKRGRKSWQEQGVNFTHLWVVAFGNMVLPAKSSYLRYLDSEERFVVAEAMASSAMVR
jgi:hypothetical protein